MPINGENYTGAEGCSVAEAVYRYNVMPRGSYDHPPLPTRYFRYEVRLSRHRRCEAAKSVSDTITAIASGDRGVITPTPAGAADSRILEGTVTRPVSPQNVVVDGRPRQVRDSAVVTSTIAPPPGGTFRRQSSRMCRVNTDALLIQCRAPARLRG
ncbi:hypothetical protein GWK47_024047 [Chionoecetes opilio]|uniref:Uncharacterized protein n=1 Tax=Chionoecetes opilio TaxID=41210 RepID=A0A8J5CE03_CHIOP|nr:hypothetical protein GWK47_024047 [Chionoecetes opilio]